jgi:hypothetical protein
MCEYLATLLLQAMKVPQACITTLAVGGWRLAVGGWR